MNKSKLFISLFLATFTPLLATWPIWAQSPTTSKLSVSPKKITESFSFYHPKCPDKTVQKTSISYPQWIGSDKVDVELKEMASGWLETAKDSAENMIYLEEDPCGNALEYFNEISFEVFKPSDSLTGILFTDLGYNGGTHGYRVYQALNYDLNTGGFVTLTDLFPDPDKSLAGFFNVIYEDICDATEPKHSTLPHFYGGVPCRKDQDKPKPPKEFLAKVDSLENLGNLVLTAKGATVNIGPHSAWSWAEGPYILQIPKEKLLLIGGNKALWENGVKTAAKIEPREQKTELNAEMNKAPRSGAESADLKETAVSQSVGERQANGKAERSAGEAS